MKKLSITQENRPLVFEILDLKIGGLANDD